MIKLGNRLLSLTKYIETGDKIMDVGCDHAKLDIYLKQLGFENKIYVCDVNPNALQNGINNIEKYDLKGEIIPILGYGIEKMTEYDIDTLVISGMGSKNIIDILSSPNIVRIYKLILQSNNNHYELRKFLTEKKFNIIEEEVVEDGKKTYVNIVAVRERYVHSYSEVEYEFGPILIKRKENVKYFQELLFSYDILMKKTGSEEIKKKIENLENIIASLVNE